MARAGIRPPAAGGGLVADPDALARLAQRFSYVVPDPLLLALVGRYSPIVEIGAGTGYWAYLLRLAGADVVAYDRDPPGERLNRYHPDSVVWSAVLKGDAAALGAHNDRTLFICWPPAFSSLGEVLSCYKGKIVIYVGDRGPRTAWVTGLERDYEMVERHDVRAIDPEPGTRPELSVWARRNP